MASIPMASNGPMAALSLIGCNKAVDRAPTGDQACAAKLTTETPQVDQSCTPPSRSQLIPPADRASARNGRAGNSACLHRIGVVREQQGVSLRSMARRLGVDVKTYKRIEDSSTDLTLSELHAVQSALDVPLEDLLVDRESLSRPVDERAKLIKVMKTAVAMRELKGSPRIERMSRMLCEQLVDVMPELHDVSGWPQFGARRGQNALGKALCQPIDTKHIGLHPES